MITIMKKERLLALTLIAVFLSSTAFAQKSKKKTVADKGQKETSSPVASFGKVNGHSVGLGLGQTVLLGNLEETGENAITLDGYYSYRASYSFDLFVNIHYSKHEFDGLKTELAGLAPAIKARVYQFDRFSPFVFAGLGFYHPRAERRINNQVIETKSKWTFGTHLGAGIDLNLNDHFSFGFLSHYHNPFDVKQELGADLEGSYFKFMLLAMYGF